MKRIKWKKRSRIYEQEQFVTITFISNAYIGNSVFIWIKNGNTQYSATEHGIGTVVGTETKIVVVFWGKDK